MGRRSHALENIPWLTPSAFFDGGTPSPLLGPPTSSRHWSLDILITPQECKKLARASSEARPRVREREKMIGTLSRVPPLTGWTGIVSGTPG